MCTNPCRARIREMHCPFSGKQGTAGSQRIYSRLINSLQGAADARTKISKPAFVKISTAKKNLLCHREMVISCR